MFLLYNTRCQLYGRYCFNGWQWVTTGYTMLRSERKAWEMRNALDMPESIEVHDIARCLMRYEAEGYIDWVYNVTRHEGYSAMITSFDGQCWFTFNENTKRHELLNTIKPLKGDFKCLYRP